MRGERRGYEEERDMSEGRVREESENVGGSERVRVGRRRSADKEEYQTLRGRGGVSANSSEEGEGAWRGVVQRVGDQAKGVGTGVSRGAHRSRQRSSVM